MAKKLKDSVKALHFKVGDRVISLDRGFDRCPTWPRGVVVGHNRDLNLVRFGDNDDQDGWSHYDEELTLDREQQPAPQRQHTLPEGSQARKCFPLFTGPVLYFPAALAAVAKLCKDGNDKHNPGEPMHHARGKSNDHEDTILRHMLDAREGDGRDEHGTPHLVNAAWRVLALLQEYLEKHDGAPLAPGAREPEGSK